MREALEVIEIVIEEDLPEPGDRKKTGGRLDVEINNNYDMVFFPGEELAWSLETTRISGGVEIEGLVKGELRLECSRCLEAYRFELEADIREHVLLLEKEEAGPDRFEEGEYRTVDGVFDLLQVIRDAIGLSLPMKRLCCEDCKGLCGICGINLNIESCGCEVDKVDARLKPLEALKEKLEGEDER